MLNFALNLPFCKTTVVGSFNYSTNSNLAKGAILALFKDRLVSVTLRLSAWASAFANSCSKLSGQAIKVVIPGVMISRY